MDAIDAMTVTDRADALIATLRGYGGAVVAFSGGVDSTVVAKAAALALGARALAVTAHSPSVPAVALESARTLARAIGIRHQVIDTREFDDPDYVRNDGSRCYYCKSELYDRLEPIRAAAGLEVICSGANLDDAGDYRPGLTAAAERNVRHPLQEAGFTKQMVRELARHWGLPNADAPASPCLSSRIAVGLEATPERVGQIEAAESLLRELGFREFRVRLHPGDHARIEVPLAELPRLIEPALRDTIVCGFKAIGFRFISLDLEGFRSGSLNVLVPVEMLHGATANAHRAD